MTHRSMFAAAAFLAAAAFALLGCQAAAAPPAIPSLSAGAVYVSASNSLFDQQSVSAPAGDAFDLYFDNRENVPHNVHIVDAAGGSIMRGEIFNGPASRTHNVPPLNAGTYRLLCDIHPGMTAQLVAEL